jgi:hypothetical protein
MRLKYAKNEFHELTKKRVARGSCLLHTKGPLFTLEMLKAQRKGALSLAPEPLTHVFPTQVHLTLRT